MENIEFEYIQLQEQEELGNEISLHYPTGGKKFIRLSSALTEFLSAEGLKWFRLKRGDDATVFMEFVKVADGEFTASVDLNPLTNLPACIVNDRAYDYLVGLLGKTEVDCGTRIEISENLTPFIPPQPEIHHLEPTKVEGSGEHYRLDFGNVEPIKDMDFDFETYNVAQMKFLMPDGREEVRYTSAFSPDELQTYNIKEFRPVGGVLSRISVVNADTYKIPYTVTPEPKPSEVATYQVYYNNDKHL
ncbi:MAG: hypothetical protein HUK05_08050 [Prevotella sp.]|nr:hypothetical protein [Prevotella sp.]